MAGVNGVRNFLDRVWRMIVDDKHEQLALNAAVQDVAPTDGQERVVHKTIKSVTHDISDLAFNTAVARMMEFVNYFTRQSQRPKNAMERFVLLLSPFAPHIAEELWALLGHNQTLAYEAWPSFDDAMTQDATIEIPVQVNGKVRGKVQVPPDVEREDLVARAKQEVGPWLEGKEMLKPPIVVPGRLLNFVVK
jgi:leucyl-tRNA synthetase